MPSLILQTSPRTTASTNPADAAMTVTKRLHLGRTETVFCEQLSLAEKDLRWKQQSSLDRLWVSGVPDGKRPEHAAGQPVPGLVPLMPVANPFGVTRSSSAMH